MNKALLLVVFLAVICFTFAQEVESDIKFGKVLKSVGKGALKVGKAYVGQKYGIQLADEEVEADKKVKFDDIMDWVGKGKQIYDLLKSKRTAEEEADIKFGKILKKVGKGALQVGKAYVNQKYGVQLADAESDIKFGKILKSVGKGALKVGKAYVGQKYGIQLADEEVEADKKVSVDEIFEYLEKAKKIYDIVKASKQAEAESDIKFGKILKSVGKGALKVGKAYVGQKYGIQLADEEAESDIKFGKVLKSVGKGALKVGKAYVGQKYGIQLSETSGPGQTAANWARSKVGGCYSQQKRDGNPCYDCSSLVYYAWRAAGKNIGATNTRMYPGNTHRVSASQLQPGDILWRSGHVGMYIGGNQYVNAENPTNGIRQRTFDASRWTAFYRPN